ncbi:MAG TPA: exodeoxyribonuclease VII small subunit [Euryarchaeota archaeon]|nr:exodeoxyribonuclease VII small subunit [Euryarchaeota archaeon]
MEDETTFETALERLKECVKKLDEGELTLDQMVSTFEEGAKMAKICQDKLGDARGRIFKLEETSSGVFEAPQEADDVE